MNIERRINAFAALGSLLQKYFKPQVSSIETWEDDFFKKLYDAIKNTENSNTWFPEKFINSAITGIIFNLNAEIIENWIENYPESYFYPKKSKTIGVVMAGNIPLVGFFDFFYVLMSGHKIVTKLSSQDKYLLPILASGLIHIEPSFEEQIVFTDSQLKNIDAIIATGSDNTSRYFEYYFGKYPNIIRKNRNSIAILTGQETIEELNLLAEDIFQYYGLGCRNVSKIFIPKGYDFSKFYNAIETKKNVIDNYKYFNNYEYNKAVYLINKTPHLDNGFLLMKEDISMHSPIATLYYEYYDNKESLNELILKQKDVLQCVISKYISSTNTISFGKSQLPNLDDYADGIDVIKFATII